MIHPELKELIPPLTKDEYNSLEQSILNEGCRDAIITWHGTIVDGHNRYKICREHNLAFEIREKEFATKEDVKLWMIRNQLARRNISNYARTTLASLSDEIQAARRQAKQNSQNNLKQNKDVVENDTHRKYEFIQSDKPKTDTLAEIAKQAGVGRETASRTVQINKAIDEAAKNNTTVAGQNPEKLKEKLMSGEMSINEAYKKVKLQEKKEQIAEAEKAVHEEATAEYKPYLTVGDGIGYVPDEKYDLLLTDPPYSTDVEDINNFVDDWLYNALDNVKPTGFAYIFIGAYPEEVKAYLNAKTPEHISLCQSLIWTYKNTLGNNPKDRYKQNYQICLFYRGKEAPDLNCPLTAEQWAVQEINAPDGRQGDRYHAWQKPMEIAERFVRHSTQQDMTVFDPFACTGTFLIAATKLGRKAYGFEINPEHAKIAYNRGCVPG